MKTEEDDYAFPFLPQFDGLTQVSTSGLTKREYFAALALQGLWASDVNAILQIHKAVELAVQSADALIEALNEEKEE